MSSSQPAPATETGDRQSLSEKLKWLMLFRLLVATVLLATGVIVQFRESEPLFSTVISTFYPVAGLVFFLAILYIPIIRYARSHKRLANSQSLVDIIIITFALYMSGGADSPLSFLYILTILSSTIVSAGTGGFWSASLSSLFYGLVINLEYYDVIPSVAEVITGLPQPIPSNVQYSMAANILAFYLVAFLGGYLARQARRAEEALQEKKVDYDALVALNNDIVRNISSGLITIDLEGAITSFNLAAERITGYTLEEAYGRDVCRIFPELTLPFHGDSSHGAGENIRGENWFKRNDGRNYFLGFTVSPLRDPAGEPMGDIIFCQDLTALKMMEKELQKADRLAAVGRFAAGIAHEIRNPLASISGSIELLRKDLVTAPGGNARLMDIVLREIDRLNGLIEEFLTYARPSLPKKELLDLNILVDETIQLFGASMPLIRCEKGEIPHVSADAGQMKQVLWNLIKNAAEAVGEDGRILVGTGLSGGGTAKGVEIAVRDNGCGIAQEDMEKIFDPFYTSKEDGNGLGLPIVHGIVEAHGGRLTVTSVIGEGSAFTVFLPLS